MPTRNVTTKFAIQGENEFRANVSAINNELKTLQSSVALVDSQFQGQANSIEALTPDRRRSPTSSRPRLEK